MDSEAASEASDSERSSVASESSLASLDSCCSLPPIIKLDLDATLEHAYSKGRSIHGYLCFSNTDNGQASKARRNEAEREKQGDLLGYPCRWHLTMLRSH